MSGAELLRRCLIAEGVEVIFGHPGGAILPFYDALHERTEPRHVLVRHEQAAAHAADGYSRATGRTGVCVATSGPGATNLVTGLATAMMDSVPLVAITGQVPTSAVGTDAFQETDIVGVTMPVTKHGFLLERPEDIPETVRAAFALARGGRPGPVVVDVPKDVQAAEISAEDASRLAAGCEAAPDLEASCAAGQRAARSLEAADGERLDTVAEILSRAERPVIMAGRGVVLSETTSSLIELAERSDAPVVTTLLGLDGFPGTHPLSAGMPGVHGTERANLAIQEADLVLGFGLRFDDRVTGRLDDFAPGAAIVHFDVSPAIVGRTVRVDHAVVGDLRETLPAFTARVETTIRPGWWKRLSGWSRTTEEGPHPDAPLEARAAIRQLARWIGARRGVVATDVGQHQMWLAQELDEAGPRTHLTSGGLGTMGYSLPSAMGAAVARPDREVWAVTGDGGFQMTFQELATLVQERLPVRVAVINNGTLGMVRQWQDFIYEGRYVASDLSGPDFVLLARAYGIAACAVSTRSELDRALRRSAEIREPLLLDVRVPSDERVFPMVYPGAALHELVTGRSEAAS